MKGCAKFLNIIALICFVLLLIVTIAFAALTAVIGVRPDLITQDVMSNLSALTVNGQPITMEMLSLYRTPLLIVVGAMAFLCLLTLIMIGQIRKALKEVAQEQPFSVRCSKALHAAAVLVVLDGILSIALNVYAAMAFAGVSINGGNALQFTSNLSFIFVAALLHMLAGVSEFGRK